MENCLLRIKNLYFFESKDTKSSDSIFDTLFNCLKTAIQNNDITGGSILPSTRKLANELKISRSTVVQVYDLLKLGKLVISRPGSSFIVQNSFSQPIKKIENSHTIRYPVLSKTGESFLNSIRFLESTQNEETAFRPGLPPLDIFPVNQWKILNNLYWRHVKDSELGYVSSSGTSRLRETLAGYLNYTRRIKCDPHQIIIVSGSLQSIYAIGNILINPGDTIAHENPTFPNIISIFNGLRANVHPVSIDKEGLIVKDLSLNGHSKPKIIHTVPSCHYPSGTRMSIQRRLELIKWANENNSVIIENDYEHEVNNYSEFLPPIYSLDNQQRTFFLGTFNRLLHPSIRIGYMVVPPHYLDAIEALLRHLHRFVPNSKQHILSQFIEKNYLYKHISNLIEVVDERKEYFSKTFNEVFNGGLEINDSDTKSLHLLAKLPDSVSDLDLIREFRTQNIVAHSSSKTYLGETLQQGLILGYSPVNKKEMKQKITKMQQIYRKFKTILK